MKGFGSDNHSGVHPELLSAITDCNLLHAPSYGTDDWTLKAQETFQRHFGPRCSAHFVFNGTGANILALKCLLKSYQSVLVSDVAHLLLDESSGPEVTGQIKLVPIPSIEGKVSVQELQKKLVRRGDQHFAQVKAVSITQPTELGTVYSLSELKEIVTFAKKENLLLHMDGSRISNAVVSLKTSFQEMTEGFDVVSFGGTKNGLLFGEAVLVLNPSFESEVKYYRKQLSQLPSKTRFIANQFNKYLGSDLWNQIAGHSLELAKYLRDRLSEIPECHIDYPVQSNAVFVRIPKTWIKTIRADHFFYVWDENTFSCRLMMSWDSEKSQIDQLIDLMKYLQSSTPVQKKA